MQRRLIAHAPDQIASVTRKKLVHAAMQQAAHGVPALGDVGNTLHAGIEIDKRLNGAFERHACGLCLGHDVAGAGDLQQLLASHLRHHAAHNGKRVVARLCQCLGIAQIELGLVVVFVEQLAREVGTLGVHEAGADGAVDAVPKRQRRLHRRASTARRTPDPLPDRQARPVRCACRPRGCRHRRCARPRRRAGP